MLISLKRKPWCLGAVQQEKTAAMSCAPSGYLRLPGKDSVSRTGERLTRPEPGFQSGGEKLPHHPSHRFAFQNAGSEPIVQVTHKFADMLSQADYIALP